MKKALSRNQIILVQKTILCILMMKRKKNKGLTLHIFVTLLLRL